MLIVLLKVFESISTETKKQKKSKENVKIVSDNLRNLSLVRDLWRF